MHRVYRVYRVYRVFGGVGFIGFIGFRANGLMYIPGTLWFGVLILYWQVDTCPMAFVEEEDARTSNPASASKSSVHEVPSPDSRKKKKKVRSSEFVSYRYSRIHSSHCYCLGKNCFYSELQKVFFCR